MLQRWTCGRSLSRTARSCASTFYAPSADRARQLAAHSLRCALGAIVFAKATFLACSGAYRGSARNNGFVRKPRGIV